MSTPKMVQSRQGVGVEHLALTQGTFVETVQLSRGRRSSPGRLRCEELRPKDGGLGGTRLTRSPPLVQAYPQDAQVLAVSQRILDREARFNPGKGASMAVPMNLFGLQPWPAL